MKSAVDNRMATTRAINMPPRWGFWIGSQRRASHPINMSPRWGL